LPESVLNPFLPLVRDSAYLSELIGALARGEAARASAIDAARPALVAALHAARGGPTLFITARPGRARQLAEELRAWLPDPATAVLFPEIEAFPYERMPVDPETAAARRAVLALLAGASDPRLPAEPQGPGQAQDGRDAHAAPDSALSTQGAASSAPTPLVVTSVRALLDRLMPPDALRARTVDLRVGTRVRPDRLLDTLVALGYTRVPLVENPGEFAQRGGIVDLFPAGSGLDEATVGATEDIAPEPQAVRLDFFGDEIDTLRQLDPVSQRSGEPVTALRLAPAHEVLPPLVPQAADALLALDLDDLREDIATAFARERDHLLADETFPLLEEYRAYLGSATLLDYLPPDALLILDEPASLAETATALATQAAEVHVDLVARGEAPRGLWPAFPAWDDIARQFAAAPGTQAPRPRVELILDPTAPGPFEHAPTYGGRLRQFLAACTTDATTQRVVVVSQQDARLRELLVEQPPNPPAPFPTKAGGAHGSEPPWNASETGVAPAPAQSAPRFPFAGGRGAGGDRGLPGPGELGHGLAVLHGALQEGWRSVALGLTLYSDHEIFGWSKTHRVIRARRPTARETFVSDFVPGEYVVHLDHGIARYRGLITLGGPGPNPPAPFPTREGGADTATAAPSPSSPPFPRREGGPGGLGQPDAQREYLLLEYGAGDHLYVPMEQSNRVSRYVGAGAEPPHLTRLSSGEWTRAKQRARRAVREIAHELLEIYAAREIQPGHAFPFDTPWQAELEGSFPYVETPDQLTALTDVKRDMERPRPMDRLLVGDVGYGKTEVALRAAFKAVMDGKQVGILVPTTVLAQQHFTTFSTRLGPFPVRVEVLSRFRSEREQREVLAALAEGKVDVVIGTHRLLQKDVAFKDLGLVIIDEEQRFGVTHKERLKRLRREVDVLTLSATPIPRTLHMAVAGVRDMSTMATAPEDRLPIRTFVSQYDDGVVRDAILRELERGGQVYFVHNRVRTISAMASQLAKLVPEARIAVGHGQMPEDELERVMLAFADGEYDVLVCSTIIESGLDIPNVNTIIVHQAHRFGLAQLYQLRGRVGRGANRAYAYFLYTRDGALTEMAEARLRTIAEATELGAGFRIAMKDLELRGAGNLLGAEQHGHISAVGFDLYCRLLGESVDSLRALRAPGDGQPAVLDGTERLVGSLGALAPAQPPGPPTKLTLPLAAYLPADYVADEAQRLRLYQRLADVWSYDELVSFMDELEDRYGPLPEAGQNLVYLVRLRIAATEAGVGEIDADNVRITLRFGGPPPARAAELARRLQIPITIGSNQLRLPRGPGTAWTDPLRDLVDALADARAPAGRAAPATAAASRQG
jgi:transcription-repair coupling factor (superfamily II helicase)